MTSMFDNWEGDRNDAAWRLSWRNNLAEDSSNFLKRDEAVFLHQALSTPCLDAIINAQGSWLTMCNGKKILDFHGNSVHHIGHAHPAIRQALSDQLAELAFSPRRYTNHKAIEFAERLCQASHHVLNRVLLMPSGSAAISAGLRLGRLWSGKEKVVTWWDSFHGATFDNCAVSGEWMFRNGAMHLEAAVRHMAPPGGDAPAALADPEVLDYMARKEGNIGVFLAEGVRHSGVLIPNADYWQTIRRICDKHGILLFMDDIPCGLGRLGSDYSFQQFQIEPDMVALGKSLGGGLYPQAALLARASANRFSAASLGHFTHEKSPLGAACGLAVLDVLKNENLYAQAVHIGNKIASSLTAAQHATVKAVRHLGALVGIVTDSEDTAQAILEYSLYNGLSFKIGGGNVLTLSPPLNISENDLAQALQILHDGLKAIPPKELHG